MPRPRKRKVSLEQKVITLNNQELITSCVCDIKGRCKCPNPENEQATRDRALAAKDKAEAILRQPRSN
jgi:hypothetical protein